MRGVSGIATALATALAVSQPVVALAAQPPTAPAGAADFRPMVNLPVEGVITNPDWLQKPGPDDFSRYYPPLAMAFNLEGLVTITCHVAAVGALERCHVDREAPVGLGFGPAALSISAFFRMKPMTVDGTPVSGGQFTTRIRFTLDNGGDKPTVVVPEAPIEHPGTLALARRLVVDLGLADRQKAALGGYFEQLRQTSNRIGETDPKAIATRNAVLESLQQAVEASQPVILDKTAKYYMKVLTPTQLVEIVTFMESPAGKAWTAHEFVPADDTTGADLYRVTMDDARQRLCKRIVCDPNAAAAPAPTPAPAPAAVPPPPSAPK